MVLRVGSGESILFWHDRWCNPAPLKWEFPRLFSVSLQQDCFIQHMGYWHSDVWHWNLLWRRCLYNWEISDLIRLEAIINRNIPQKEVVDDVSWRGSTSSGYPIQSIVEKFYASSRAIIPNQFIKSIWHKHIPLPTVVLHIWFIFLINSCISSCFLGLCCIWIIGDGL